MAEKWWQPPLTPSTPPPPLPSLSLSLLYYFLFKTPQNQPN